MAFDLAAVNVRCDVDRALFLAGKIDPRNLFGAVKIKHSICDMKTFNKHPKKKKDKKKRGNSDDDGDDLSEE